MILKLTLPSIASFLQQLRFPPAVALDLRGVATTGRPVYIKTNVIHMFHIICSTDQCHKSRQKQLSAFDASLIPQAVLTIKNNQNVLEKLFLPFHQMQVWTSWRFDLLKRGTRDFKLLVLPGSANNICNFLHISSKYIWANLPVLLDVCWLEGGCEYDVPQGYTRVQHEKRICCESKQIKETYD